MEQTSKPTELEEASHKSVIESDHHLGADFEEPFDQRSESAQQKIDALSEKANLPGFVEDGDDEDLRQASTRTNKDSVVPDDEELKDPNALRIIRRSFSKEIKSDDEGKKEDLKNHGKHKKEESYNKSDNEC